MDDKIFSPKGLKSIKKFTTIKIFISYNGNKKEPFPLCDCKIFAVTERNIKTRFSVFSTIALFKI